jgi:hypothetical protein
MKTLQALLEMAKRSTPEQFYQLALKKYGKDAVKALKWPEIAALAKEHDILIPAYIRSQKVGRGSFSAVPPDHKEPESKIIDQFDDSFSRFGYKGSILVPRSELPGVGKGHGPIKAYLMSLRDMPADLGISTGDGYETITMYSKTATSKQLIAALKSGQDPKKVMSVPAKTKEAEPEIMKKVQSAVDDLRSRMRDQQKQDRFAEWRRVDPKEGHRAHEVRYWGTWEGDDGSGDYDWQRLSREDGELIKRLIAQIEKWYPGVQLDFSTEEKNWIVISAEPKK